MTEKDRSSTGWKPSLFTSQSAVGKLDTTIFNSQSDKILLCFAPVLPGSIWVTSVSFNFSGTSYFHVYLWSTSFPCFLFQSTSSDCNDYCKEHVRCLTQVSISNHRHKQRTTQEEKWSESLWNLENQIGKMLKQSMFDFPRFSILILTFVHFSGRKLFGDDKYNSNATYVLQILLSFFIFSQG